MSVHITLDGTTPLCCTDGAGGWPGEPVPDDLVITELVEHVTCIGCWAQVPTRARWSLGFGRHCMDLACEVPHFRANRLTDLAVAPPIPGKVYD